MSGSINPYIIISVILGWGWIEVSVLDKLQQTAVTFFLFFFFIIFVIFCQLQRDRYKLISLEVTLQSFEKDILKFL